MQGDEIRALRRLQREQGLSSHVFMSERDGPMMPKAFHALFGRIGVRAKMPFPIHPHMLRHGCGYALANAGHDTRGKSPAMAALRCGDRRDVGTRACAPASSTAKLSPVMTRA
jgi:integrase